MIPIVEETALRAAVSPERAVAAMRAAFEADGLGRTRVPAVINLDVPPRGEFHVKTAYIEGVPHVAVKIASGFYDNPSRGLPSGSGLMAIFDAATGLPVALLLDNGFLTDIRTAAAGALAGLSYISLYEAYDRGRVSVVSPLVATESLWGVAL